MTSPSMDERKPTPGSSEDIRQSADAIRRQVEREAAMFERLGESKPESAMTAERKADAHTPGPWMVGAVSRPHGLITGVYVSQPYDGVEGGRIAECFGNCLVTTDEAVMANARLVAAAPELFATLEELRDASRCHVRLRGSTWHVEAGDIKDLHTRPMLGPFCTHDDAVQGWRALVYDALARADAAINAVRVGGQIEEYL